MHLSLPAQEDDEYVLDELFYKTACRMSRVAVSLSLFYNDVMDGT